MAAAISALRHRLPFVPLARRPAVMRAAPVRPRQGHGAGRPARSPRRQLIAALTRADIEPPRRRQQRVEVRIIQGRLPRLGPAQDHQIGGRCLARARAGRASLGASAPRPALEAPTSAAPAPPRPSEAPPAKGVLRPRDAFPPPLLGGAAKRDAGRALAVLRPAVPPPAASSAR